MHSSHFCICSEDSDEIELETEEAIEEIVSEQPLPTTQTLEILGNNYLSIYPPHKHLKY